MKRLTLPLLALTFLLVGFSGGFIVGQSRITPIPLLSGPAANTPDSAIESFEPFWEVYTLVQTRYFDQPVSPDTLAEGAINGMLEVLEDPNTRYLAPADEQAAREEMDGEFEGIGAYVEEVEGNITVVAPIEGSPAEAAGLEPGDILREADGTVLTGMAVDEAAGLVRGPRGTTVSLVVERDGERFEVDIVRDRITIASVRGEMLEDNIAYVRLSRFANTTQDELNDVLNELDANEAAGLILDLRSNPGGGLDTAVAVADQFLGEGTILVERFGDGNERVFESTDEGLAETVPMVVLIDEGSASASEVLAGAVRDRDRGTLIGQTSFGKGTVQTWQGLSNGGGVRITIARWLTPDDVWVHEDGLAPDYFIPLPDETVDEGDAQDTQLEAAVDFLLGQPIISIPPEPEAETQPEG